MLQGIIWVERNVFVADFQNYQKGELTFKSNNDFKDKQTDDA